MEIIREPLSDWDETRARVPVAVERLTLAKRRWRGVADDGCELGFDLERPLADGAAVWETDAAVYVIAQKYEPVLEVRIAEGGLHKAEAAARIGWMIGNLHFLIEVTHDVVRVVDDPAVRQLFAREGLAFRPGKRVFHPISGGHQH